ncbi:MAG: HigA family addiction module antitoxin [Thermodesulfobacteriota bacterium]
MTRAVSNAFKPNYAVPPGETLKETMEAIGMTQAELSQRTGYPRKTIKDIIHGKTAITPDTAIRLERVLGVPASFWNNLEKNYQERLKSVKMTALKAF